MLKLGDEVRDMITGFQGVLIARTEWLRGCVRLTIQPRELKDGKPIESESFDEQQVELVEPKEKPMSEQSRAESGGPYPTPSR